MFLASLYVGIEAIRSNQPRDWLLWGIALGLYFGSKYVSLVYAPIVLLLPRHFRYTSLPRSHETRIGEKVQKGENTDEQKSTEVKFPN